MTVVASKDISQTLRAPLFLANRHNASVISGSSSARRRMQDLLPHRTGHGIGLDGHEWTYFVRGNKTPIQPGMCFNDEPTIVIYGEFGVRLEDCLYITPNGPKFFTEQSPSVEKPFG